VGRNGIALAYVPTSLGSGGENAIKLGELNSNTERGMIHHPKTSLSEVFRALLGSGQVAKVLDRRLLGT
jgi:hypothetical protein